MGIKGIRIRLLNTDLIRRFGNCEIEVDPSLARTYVEKNLATYKNKEDLNKLVKNIQIIEEKPLNINYVFRETIFPDFIINNIG